VLGDDTAASRGFNSGKQESNRERPGRLKDRCGMTIITDLRTLLEYL
jgi:hypothetical protein